MATGAARLPQVLEMVAGELVAEVCSAYGLRSGEILELRATHGLNESAVGRTRLRVGEGIVGLVAATGQILNLADAQNHPSFVYRPETGEEPYASMLAVPVRRGGRTLGVLAVQNRSPRHYSDDETEVLETIAMLRDGRLDAFATNKAILYELSDALPGSTVLGGSWGLEHFAAGIPKGRDGGRAAIARFVSDVQHDGTVARAVARAGLRGTVAASSDR